MGRCRGPLRRHNDGQACATDGFSHLLNGTVLTTFADLGLAQPILEALNNKGYTDPTPVQAAAIPLLMARRDVMASAATGTGKTAAFMLPALHFLTDKSPKQGRGPRILVLSPTRELAAQIKTATETYGRGIRFAKVVSIVGGLPYPLQLKLLSNPVEILVATPGRLIDLMQRGKIDLNRLEMLVLDEADRMLDLGFRDDIAYIAEHLPKERVTALFSATLDGEIIKIGQSLLNAPERVEIAAPPRREEQIVEKLHYADDIMHKARLLERVLDDVTGQAIVFTATKIDADSLADKLLAAGKKVAPLHGDMNQRDRTRTLNRLKKGEIDVLVATDVAARGIDVVGITHVVNFDLPKFAEDYVHRIGRTGRAGRDGIAISFAAKHEIPALKRIEKFIGRAINPFQFEGLEARFEPRANKPRSQGGGRFSDRPRGEGRFAKRDSREGRDSRDSREPREPRSYGDARPPRSNYDGQPRSAQPRSPFENRDSRRHEGQERRYEGDRRQEGSRPAGDNRGNRSYGDKPWANKDGNRTAAPRHKVYGNVEVDSSVYHEQPQLTMHSPMPGGNRRPSQGQKSYGGNYGNRDGNRGSGAPRKRSGDDNWGNR